MKNIHFPIAASSKKNLRRAAAAPISSSRGCSYEMQTIHMKVIPLCGQRNITEVRK